MSGTGEAPRPLIFADRGYVVDEKDELDWLVLFSTVELFELKEVKVKPAAYSLSMILVPPGRLTTNAESAMFVLTCVFFSVMTATR